MLNNSAKLSSENLHVLEIATRYGAGGIQRHVLDLRDWLRARGHDVILAGTADVWAGPGEASEFLELPTRYVAAEGGSVFRRFAYALRAAWRLRRWLSRNSVDLIHCHESAPALVALLARIGTGTPLAITYHGAAPERIPSFGRIARHCDLVFTTNNYSADDLEKTGGVSRDRIRVIGLGLRPPPADSASDIAVLREKLLGDGKRLIVTIARLTHQKGIDTLIECVRQLKQTHPEYRFALAGDGSGEKKLKELARDRKVDSHLTFVGRTERPHLYLRTADLFLLTSRWEAKPIAIAEAFQVGKPAVATACSGVFELIDDTVGAVVPIDDVNAICAAVTDILEDERRRLEMAQAALARSQEDQFDPNIQHQKFERVYLDMAGRL